MQEIKDKEVYKSIKSGLKDLKILARYNLAKRWMKIPKKTRWSIGRALVYMEHVAKNPEAYFSKATTEDPWKERVKEWAKKNNANMELSFHLVQDPKDIVFCNTSIAMDENLSSIYHNFCQKIQDWEYSRTRKDDIGGFMATNNAIEIIKMSKLLNKKVQVMKDPCILRPFKRFYLQFQR